jgi:hypothetical protein
VPLIGRLVKIEAQKNDFVQYKPGDRISVKVLRIAQGKSKVIFTHCLENGKTWIELTRRKEHLDLPSGILDEKFS